MDTWGKWLGGAFTAILGAIFTPPLIVAMGTLLFLFWADAATGAVANAPFDPARGTGGWRRKTNTFILVLSVAVLQAMAGYVGDTELAKLPAAVALASGFCFFELMSVVRNTIKVGGGNPYLLKVFGIETNEASDTVSKQPGS